MSDWNILSNPKNVVILFIPLKTAKRTLFKNKHFDWTNRTPISNYFRIVFIKQT